MHKTFQHLFHNARTFTYDKGLLVISPDDLPRGVFYLYNGYIKTYDISAEGEYQLLHISGPGDIIPLHWALDYEYRPLFYETICTTKVSLLPKDEFKNRIMNSNEYLSIALEAVLTSYAIIQERVYNLQLKTARQRLAFRLIFLATHFGQKKGDTVDLLLPITYQDLADSLSITRETVNRNMRLFMKEGLVTRSDHHLIVTNLTALKAVLGDDHLPKF